MLRRDANFDRALLTSLNTVFCPAQGLAAIQPIKGSQSVTKLHVELPINKAFGWSKNSDDLYKISSFALKKQTKYLPPLNSGSYCIRAWVDFQTTLERASSLWVQMESQRKELG